jgi:prepilin-type N-terminal cleavage/methylation domain-containing protein
MAIRARQHGFSLVEILLVLAILGILSGFAIPQFLGQRRRARVIGDAQSNARVLAMSLESRKADNGTYGTAGPYAWTASGSRPSSDLAPSFIPKGNSKMNFALAVGSTGLSYLLTVTDPSMAGTPTVLTTTQNGSIQLNTSYNK